MPTLRAVASALTDEQVFAVGTMRLGDTEVKLYATGAAMLAGFGEQLGGLTMRAGDLEL